MEREEEHCEIWHPFKTFHRLADDVVHCGRTSKVAELKTACENLHLRFLSPLKNPPRDANSKNELEKAKTDGIPVPGRTTPQVLGEALVDEAFVLADIFQMNELIALDLVLLGETQMMNFPGLPRGLVAILLYYDARKDLLHGLGRLLQAAAGRTWDFDIYMDPQVHDLTMNLRDQLVKDGFIGKILDALAAFSVTGEWETLAKNRALGNPRHRRMVLDMLLDIERTCAQLVYFVAAQAGLSPEDATKLLAHLRCRSLASSPSGTLDDTGVALLISALYAVNSPGEDEIEPLAKEEGFDPVVRARALIAAVHAELGPKSDRGIQWACPGLKAVLQLAWGLSLRHMAQNRSISMDAETSKALEEDELVVDKALLGFPFAFLKTAVLPNSRFVKEEFYLRAIHGVITDFIVLMPMKAKELRNLAAATIPQPDDTLADPGARNYVDLLEFMSGFYALNSLDLCLNGDFWVSQEVISETSPRQIALHKFVRMCAESPLPWVLVPFFEMLAALSSTPKTAHLCFELLRTDQLTPPSANDQELISWKHFIQSVERYCQRLRQEQTIVADGIYPQPRPTMTSITNMEIRGLKAAFNLIRTVGKYDPAARMEFLGRSLWSIPELFLGFVACPVILELKASVLRTLAALCPNPAEDEEANYHTGLNLARDLWNDLESVQLLRTIPLGSGISLSQTGDIRTELEEVETRQEEFPLTRAFIELLSSLCRAEVPLDLGSPHRQPGFEPYLSFVVDSVLSKFITRVYKDRKEMWLVGTACLNLLVDVITNNPTTPEDFALDAGGSGSFAVRRRGPRGPGPGYLVMKRVLTGEGDLVRLAMFIVEESVQALDRWDDVSAIGPLMDASLAALRFLSACLDAQTQYLNMQRDVMASGVSMSILTTHVDRVLVGINQRSGKANYLLTIAKLVPVSRWFPQHSREALNILYRLATSRAAQAQMISLFTSPGTKSEILHGFVECLEDDENEVDGYTEEKPGAVNRLKVLRLILRCLGSSVTQPNIAHFLLGFNINEPLYQTSLQNPGVMNTQRSCLHAIINILDAGFVDAGGIGGDLGDAIEQFRQPANSLLMPESTTLCYQILFKLCSSTDTGPTTLRYLRNSREFLLRHLQMLPFSGEDKVRLWDQMCWLLRTLAVDLATSINRGHKTHLARLVAALLDPDFDADADGNDVKLPVSLGGAVGSPDHCRLSDLLKAAGDFSREVDKARMAPDLDLMDLGVAKEIMEATKAPAGGGLNLYNVPRLRQLLERELAATGMGYGTPEFPAYQGEIQRILDWATRMNSFFSEIHALNGFLDGLRRVMEVLFFFDPPEFIEEVDNQRLTVHLANALLDKCNEENALMDLNQVASGSLLVLVNCLANSFATERENPKSDGKSDFNSSSRERGEPLGPARHRDGLIKITGKLIALLLKNHDHDRMRTYLYATLAKLVIIANDCSDSPASGGGMGGRDNLNVSLADEMLGVVGSFGETFFRTIAIDCFSGHEAVRIAALSCLTHVCRLHPAFLVSPASAWPSSGSIASGSSAASALVASRRFLQPLLSSIVTDDRRLGDELLSVVPVPGDSATGRDGASYLPAVTMFQSKVSLLSAAALTGSAEVVAAMLEAGLASTLAQVTSLQRQLPRGNSGFEASQAEHERRHRGVLVPALRVIGAAFGKAQGRLLADDGGVAAVLSFLASFHETVVGILTSGQPWFKLPFLKETLALSEILVLLAPIDPVELGTSHSVADSSSGVVLASMELHSRYMIYRRLFLQLMAKYLLSDRAFSEVERENPEADREEARAAYLGILVNVVQFASQVVAGSGKKMRRQGDASLGAAAMECLFGPSLVEGTAREVQRINESQTLSSVAMAGDQATSLGVVVYQLKKAASHFITTNDAIVKMAASPGASKTSDDPGATLNKAAAVAGKMGSARREKRLLGDLVEGCLFLVVHHLRFYLVDAPAAASAAGTTFFQRSSLPPAMTPKPSSGYSGLRRDDLVQLKSDMGLAIGDSLFAALKQVSGIMIADRRDPLFLDAQAIRLRRLANRHSS